MIDSLVPPGLHLLHRNPVGHRVDLDLEPIQDTLRPRCVLGAEFRPMQEFVFDILGDQHLVAVPLQVGDFTLEKRRFALVDLDQDVGIQPDRWLRHRGYLCFAWSVEWKV